MSQMNPVRFIDPYLPKTIKMLLSYLSLALPSGLIRSGLPTKIL